MKRYAVTVDFYIHAPNDKVAIEMANDIAEDMDRKEDNKANVLSVHSAPFGNIKPKRIS